MEYTITLGSLLTAILIIVAIIAIIFLIVLLARIISSLRTLPDTMQRLDNIMSDVEGITGVARSGAEGAKVIVKKAVATAAGVNDVLDTNKSTLRAATGLVNAVTSLTSVVKDKEKPKDKPKEKEKEQK